tara:strand:+ start:1252 stop:2205 length:954 start_codon:yes stop_codon:yes gene_type:complete
VTTKNNFNIAVLFGGISSEREVSIKSAMEIISALKSKYDLQLIELNQLNFSNFVHTIKDNTLVFNALHGGEGENGQIQSFLSQHHIIYTGSGPMASMLAMNKHFTKIIASENNIKTPDWLTFRFDKNNTPKLLSYKINEKLKFPVVVKPNFQGSTLGLSIIKNKNDIDDAIKLASIYSNEIIIEEFIDGRELTVGVLGNRALDIVEILPKSGFYNYKSKYTKGETDYISPADLDANLANFIKEEAIRIYKAIGCRHYARVDFLLDKESNPYLLEINTLPGMCSTSLLPMSANSKGINFEELLDLIIKIAVIDNDMVL